MMWTGIPFLLVETEQREVDAAHAVKGHRAGDAGRHFQKLQNPLAVPLELKEPGAVKRKPRLDRLGDPEEFRIFRRACGDRYAVANANPAPPTGKQHAAVPIGKAIDRELLAGQIFEDDVSGLDFAPQILFILNPLGALRTLAAVRFGVHRKTIDLSGIAVHSRGPNHVRERCVGARLEAGNQASFRGRGDDFRPNPIPMRGQSDDYIVISGKI